MLQNCKIIDTTLREGEQTPGVAFPLAEKKQIIDMLAAIGVAEIEIGLASPYSSCATHLARHCRQHHPGLATALWSRCNREDIVSAAAAAVDRVALSIPASDLHLLKKLGKSRQWATATLKESIHLARDQGLEPAVGLEDATRADVGFVTELAAVAAEAGAFRLRLADTVGTGSPGSIGHLVAQVSTACPQLPLGIHTHNDFGMAMGNGLAALEAGARWIDATVLGLGERTGCARLEEVVGYLHLVAGCQELRTENLATLATFVAKRARRPIAVNTPIIGRDIFTCETGLHLQGLQRDPTTYEPYPPEKVGGNRRLLYGSKTGRVSLHQRYRQLVPSLMLDDRQLLELTSRVRRRAQELKRSLSDAELIAMLPRPCPSC